MKGCSKSRLLCFFHAASPFSACIQISSTQIPVGKKFCGYTATCYVKIHLLFVFSLVCAVLLWCAAFVVEESEQAICNIMISLCSSGDFVDIYHFLLSPESLWNWRVLTCVFVPRCRTHSVPLVVLFALLWTCSIFLCPFQKLNAPELLVTFRMDRQPSALYSFLS